MQTEADLRLKRSLKAIGTAPFKSVFWKRLRLLITLVYLIAIEPISVAARELMFVGRGDRLYTTFALLLASAGVFAIAAQRQDLGGDALFLVGAYLVGKWAVETVARLGRGREPVDEDDSGEGESIFAIAGVRNRTLTLTIGALFGFLLLPFQMSNLVGLLLFVGCVLAILENVLWNLRARVYIAQERSKEEHAQMRSRASESARDGVSRAKTFQRVEID